MSNENDRPDARAPGTSELRVVPTLIHRDNLHQLLKHRTANAEQADRSKPIRDAAYTLCNAILALTPVCPEQQSALHKVGEAFSLANDAIDVEGGL